MIDATHVSPGMDGKSGSRGVDWMIGELAERQHGVVARWQLLKAGMGVGAIEWRIAKGRLRRVHRGAYAVGHRSLSCEGHWMAAVLSAGPEAVLSHRSAGQAWRIVPLSPSWPEVTRPTTIRPRSDLRVHCSPLPQDEIAVVGGIPVTYHERRLTSRPSSASGKSKGLSMRLRCEGSPTDSRFQICLSDTRDGGERRYCEYCWKTRRPCEELLAVSWRSGSWRCSTLRVCRDRDSTQILPCGGDLSRRIAYGRRNG